MKKFTLPLLLATTLVAASCSNDENVINDEDNSGKTRIALSGTDGEMAMSRAGFSNNTRVVARIVSDNRDGSSAKKCVTTVLTAKQEDGTKGYSDVVYANGKTRYWDDAYGRNSILSVYAVAVPNVSNGDDGTNLPDNVLKGGETWGTTNADDNTLAWAVATTQTAESLNNQDLTYSNNIQEGNVGANGIYTWNYTSGSYPDFTPSNAIKHGTDPNIDGRLYFTQSATYNAKLSDAPGHFDRGQMEFKHALTRVQVNLKKGDGYDGAAFNVTGMQVLSQSATGTFDIKAASWTDKGTATAINMAAVATGAGMAATYEAQMLPGYTFSDTETNAIKLIVDGNTYFITNKMLRSALSGKDGINAEFSSEMGKRYIFTLEVVKNKIQNITATIVEWNDITAEEKPVNNSHVTFSFYNHSGTACTDLKLWKYAETLTSGIATDNTYTAPATSGNAYTAVDGFKMDSETNKYITSEYYNDNQTAYHFRSTNAATNLDSGDKTFTMQSGSATTNDYHWGAPMNTGITAIPYNDNAGDTQGYLSSIAKGIVAASTESEIKLTEIHMMSQLVVKLTTSSDASAVNLTNASVTLTKFSESGTVDMGSGFIVPSETLSGSGMALAPGESNTYSLYVVPQLLKRNSGASDNDYIGITIHTQDNNEYYIVKKLSEIKATSVGSEVTNKQTADNYITQWFPGHKYSYTFKITKTEIKNITATIVGWQDVTAGSTDLDLEK